MGRVQISIKATPCIENIAKPNIEFLLLNPVFRRGVL